MFEASDSMTGQPDTCRAIRELIRSRSLASLATALPASQASDVAWPYVSLVLVAVDHDLSPILLLSDLAEHTRAIAADCRVSLLFDGTAGLAQPLAGPRVTLLGRATRTDDQRLQRRFVQHHPDSEMYAGFRDFNFYRVSLERAHLVGGFGKIRWISPKELRGGPSLPELAENEPGIVSHMNDDHADAVQLYAGRLLGLAGDGWIMTGIDAEGIDLRRGGDVARLPFDEAMTAAGQARQLLVSLVAKARAA